jgi:hypothetical protein
LVHPRTGIGNGAASLIFLLNKIPYNGTCTVTPENGTSLQTLFTFKCQDWLDADGTIDKFSFYSRLDGVEIDTALGSSKSGELRTKLPEGADLDEYRMSLYVQVTVIIESLINSDINYVLISVFLNLFKNKTIEDKSESEAV